MHVVFVCVMVGPTALVLKSPKRSTRSNCQPSTPVTGMRVLPSEWVTGADVPG